VLFRSPEVKWSSSLGESGIFRGSDALYSSLTGTFAGPGSRNSLSSSAFAGQSASQLVSNIADTKGVQIKSIHVPSRAIVGEEFEVLVRITNNTMQPLTLSLRSKHTGYSTGSSSGQLGYDDMNGLCFVGIATINLGLLAAGESFEKTIQVYPLSAGLHDLKDLVVVDTATLKEYSSGVLSKIFVSDVEEEDNEANDDDNDSDSDGESECEDEDRDQGGDIYIEGHNSSRIVIEEGEIQMNEVEDMGAGEFDVSVDMLDVYEEEEYEVSEIHVTEIDLHEHEVPEMLDVADGFDDLASV